MIISADRRIYIPGVIIKGVGYLPSREVEVPEELKRYEGLLVAEIIASSGEIIAKSISHNVVLYTGRKWLLNHSETGSATSYRINKIATCYVGEGIVSQVSNEPHTVPGGSPYEFVLDHPNWVDRKTLVVKEGGTTYTEVAAEPGEDEYVFTFSNGKLEFNVANANANLTIDYHYHTTAPAKMTNTGLEGNTLENNSRSTKYSEASTASAPYKYTAQYLFYSNQAIHSGTNYGIVTEVYISDFDRTVLAIPLEKSNTQSLLVTYEATCSNYSAY